MSDMTSMTPASRSAKPAKTEFMVYFAIIFAATLPLATITWAIAAIRSGSMTDKGPIKRAYVQAGIITPMIFAA